MKNFIKIFLVQLTVQMACISLIHAEESLTQKMPAVGNTEEQLSQAVAIAIHENFPEILKKNSGSVSCQPVLKPFQFDFGLGVSLDSLSATGKDQKFAMTYSQLSCIRKACELLPNEVNSKAEEIHKDKELLYQTLKEEGLDDSAIASLSNKEPNRNKLTCLTSGNMQILAYSICVSVPYTCKQQ